jgi:RNA polymerase sigma factor (sigma-70 family)
VLRNRTDAEDISQLAFLVLARQEMTIHSSLQYWLHKVTRNASIALLRAKSRRLRYEAEAAKPDETLAAEDLHIMRDELHVALANLPDHLSEAVRLRYLEGWTQQEAAAIVGCPRGTLSQRASQGLQTLRELMAHEQRDAG